MSRIDFLRNKFSDQVNLIGHNHDHSCPTDIDVFEQAVKTDPTRNKIYLEFIIRRYIDARFKYEDFSRVNETLSLFHRVKARLPKDERDIGRYSGEDQIWELLESRGLAELDIELLSGKEIKRSDKDKACQESEILSSEGWSLVTLNTPFAARWWGMRTRWCTTEKTGRTFYSYHEKGPIRVLIRPDGSKFQLHVQTASLCNANDSHIGMNKVAPHEAIPQQFLDVIENDIVSMYSSISELLLDKVETIYSRRAGKKKELRSRIQPQHVKTLISTTDVFSGIINTSNRIKSFFERWAEDRIVLAECDGWRISHAANIIAVIASKMIINGRINDAFVSPCYGYDKSDWEDVCLVETPGGDKFEFDFNNDGMDLINSTFSSFHFEIGRALLSKALDAVNPANRTHMESLSKAINSLPVNLLDQTTWNKWASAIALAEGKEAKGILPKSYKISLDIPTDVFNEKIVSIFSKAALIERIPGQYLCGATVMPSILHRPALIQLQKIRSYLNEENFVDFAAFGQAIHFSYLPDEMKTLEFMLKVVERNPMSLKVIYENIHSGSVRLNGMSKEDARQKCGLIALHRTASVLSWIDFEIPRELILQAVSREGSSLKWVPIDHRDMEMCVAAISCGNSNGLCHLPRWAVNEIWATSDELSALVKHYRPASSYKEQLNSAVMPKGPTPQKIKPVASY